MSNPYVNLWHGKPTGKYFAYAWDGSSITSFAFTQEGIDNAWAAYGCYTDKGWSAAAIAAVVGMQCWESGLNPWRWQSDNVIAMTSSDRYNTLIGYGLPQFTPQAQYSDPATVFAGNLSQYQYLIDYFNNDAEFRRYFAPNYSDHTGRPSDGEAQCLYVNRQCTGSGFYFRRIQNGSPMHYTFGYMPFSDFSTASIGTIYTSPRDTAPADCDVDTYAITLDILIYQWVNNFGRGVSETPESTALRSRAANELYTLYTGTPPIPPPVIRRKMPLWMMLRPFRRGIF